MNELSTPPRTPRRNRIAEEKKLLRAELTTLANKVPAFVNAGGIQTTRRWVEDNKKAVVVAGGGYARMSKKRLGGEGGGEGEGVAAMQSPNSPHAAAPRNPHSPIAIEDPNARACRAPGGEEIVGEGRQGVTRVRPWRDRFAAPAMRARATAAWPSARHSAEGRAPCGDLRVWPQGGPAASRVAPLSSCCGVPAVAHDFGDVHGDVVEVLGAQLDDALPVGVGVAAALGGAQQLPVAVQALVIHQAGAGIDSGDGRGCLRRRGGGVAHAGLAWLGLLGAPDVADGHVDLLAAGRSLLPHDLDGARLSGKRVAGFVGVEVALVGVFARIPFGAVHLADVPGLAQPLARSGIGGDGVVLQLGHFHLLFAGTVPAMEISVIREIAESRQKCITDKKPTSGGGWLIEQYMKGAAG